MDRTPSSVAMKLSNLASLDPAITGTGRTGLKGASALDRNIWQDFSHNTETWMPRLEARLAQLLEPQDDSPAPELGMIEETADYSADDLESSATRRKGQNLFRKAVLSAYQWRCCITGVAEPRLLVAGHIRPWRCDQANRLNPRNGLCLSTLIDRAFDTGLITISEDLCLVLSSELQAHKTNEHIHETFFSRQGISVTMPEKFAPDPAFLAWHREKVFLR